MLALNVCVLLMTVFIAASANRHHIPKDVELSLKRLMRSGNCNTFGLGQCTNGNCYYRFNGCNGNDDCGDGSDETNCQEGPVADVPRCGEGEFECSNDRCIPGPFRCDDDDDCGDHSDEVDCGTLQQATKQVPGSGARATCQSGEFTCHNGRCIHRDYQCDNDNDCGDNSDEMMCRPVADNLLAPLTDVPRCGEGEFECSNDRCIPGPFRCDDDDDCGDHSDEDNCGTLQKANTNSVSAATCPAGYFTCTHGECIPTWRLCDGTNDCGDRSDEQKCGRCSVNQFQCGNGNCIPTFLVCDSDPDCDDSSDEQHCDY